MLGGQRTAVYLAEPSGVVREVVATGDLFDVQGTGGPGAGLRTITLIQFGAMNPSGEIALRLDFDDGRSGHYHVSPTGTVAVEPPAGRGVLFAQNAPNPFARSTRFDFELPAAGRVALSVFDASGRLVRRVLDGPRQAGRQAVEWDGRDQAGAPLTSGIYWARFQSRQHGVRANYRYRHALKGFAATMPPQTGRPTGSSIRCKGTRAN